MLLDAVGYEKAELRQQTNISLNPGMLMPLVSRGSYSQAYEIPSILNALPLTASFAFQSMQKVSVL
jgi:hypothetical protein